MRQWTIQGFAGSEAGVAVDRAGSVIYVADPFFGGTGRIIAYDPNGAVVGVLDKAHGVDVERPLGLAVDSAGNLHVFEGDRNRVLVLAPNGSPLRTIAPPAPTRSTTSRRGIALDAQDNLYVADTRASRIEVFGPAAASAEFPLGGTSSTTSRSTPTATSTRS